MAAPKVLVVEDDLHTRRIIEKVLERDQILRYRNIEVISAADGQEGIAAYDKHRPDVVLTDLLMPRVDGFALVEHIRATDGGADIPVMVMSAVFRDRSTLNRLRDELGVRFQPKPFSPRALAQSVRAMLRVVKPEPAGAAAEPAGEQPAGQPHGRPRRASRLLVVQPAPVAQPAQPAPAAKAAPRGAQAALARARAHVAAERPARRAEGAAPPFDRPPAAPLPTPTNGTFAESPLPQLLFEAVEGQANGKLELTRGKVRKVVYLMGGYPIFVQSNLRAETLGQLLMRRGGLSAEQHAAVLAEAQARGIKYGEALVHLGLMSEREVMDELVAQTRYKVMGCLRWHDGTWSFSPGSEGLAAVPRCTIDPVRAVFSGLRHGFDADEAMDRLERAGGRDATVLLAPEVERYRATFVAIHGRELLDRARLGATLGELLALRDPSSSVLQLETLLLSGLLELVPAEAAASEQPSKAAARSSRRPSLTLAALVDAGATAPPLVDVRVEAGDDEIVLMPRSAEGAVDRDEPGPDAAELRDELVGEREVLRAAASPRRRARRAAPSQAEIELARQLIEASYLGLHDKNHYQVLGVIPETGAAGIEVAYQIKRKQFALERYRDLDVGASYSHLEEIVARLDEAFAVLSDAAARAAYDKTLQQSAASTRSRALEAEERFRQGEAAMARERYADAARLFAEASQLDEQGEYVAREALASFLAANGSTEAAVDAMVRLVGVLENDPEQVAAHLAAAQISRAVGNDDEAQQHLTTLLKIDPTQRDAFDELEDLLLSGDRIDDLELSYRRTIHLLGRRDPPWAAQLWKRLVLLYRDRIGDAAKAKLACQAALKLNPTDRDLRAVMAELESDDPERWPEALLGYRAVWRGNPRQAEPLHQIFELHKGAGRLDAAFVAASAAVLQGCARMAEQQLYLSRRSERLNTAPRRLVDIAAAAGAAHATLAPELHHHDDDPNLVELFERLSPLIEQLHPLRVDDLGFDEDGADEASDQPLGEQAARVLSYVCNQLGMTPPRVVVRAALADDIQGAGVDPPLLLVGTDAQANDDAVELAFRFARALTLVSPGRRAVAWRPAQVARSYLLASLVATYPSLGIPNDPRGDIGRILEGLDRLDGLQDAVKETVRALRGRVERVNIGGWKRAIHRTADRVGLLLCGDLTTAGAVLSALEPDAQLDLIDFALSQQYGALRHRLGLSL